MRIRYLIILFIFLFGIVSTNVYAKDFDYVIDNGELLKEKTEDYINTYSEFLDKEAKIEYYVVTISQLDNYDLDIYAEEVYNNIINNKNDNGLLILISRNDRKVKVIAGSGISEVIDNELIDKFIKDYFISFLSSNEWDAGIKNGYTAFFKYICLHLDVDTSGLEVTNGNDFIYKYRFYILFVCIWICNIIGYILPKYFIKLFNKNYKVSMVENLIFYGCVFVNVIILYYNYIFMKRFLFVILAFEIFSILSGTILNTNINKKVKVSKKNKKKRIHVSNRKNK